MKSLRYHLLFLLAGSAAGLVSCDLHETLLDTPTPSIITTEDGVNSLVRGAYAYFGGGYGFKNETSIMLLLSADDIYSDGNGTYRVYSEKQYNAATTDKAFTFFYNIAGSANGIIAALDRLDLDPAYESRVYGEARFLRAFAYFYLVRLYGGVPLRPAAVTDGSNFYLHRNTVDEVYDRIFKDFKNASASLPLASEIPSAELGRASKGAAQALMASAYLTYGNYLELKGKDPADAYRNAGIYADSVINSGQYHLIPDYANLWDVKKETEAYQEVIFGIRFTAEKGNGSKFAHRFAPGNIGGLSGQKPYGTGAESYKVQPYIYDYYTSGIYQYDYRARITYLEGGVNPRNGKYIATFGHKPLNNGNTNRGVFLAKYQDPDGETQNSNNNDLFIIRLAEIYLIKAEADNELHGPTPEAVAAFNALRKRARNDPGKANKKNPADLELSDTLTKADFRLKIFHEREAELIGEAHRWFDLVRMQGPQGYPQTMFDYQFALLKKQPFINKNRPRYDQDTESWNGHGTVYGPSMQAVSRNKLFPIPEEELAINPNFGGQNAGW